jgi:hypothetical protein
VSNPLHDFRSVKLKTVTVIFPDSQQALTWCYEHLNEDAARFSTSGYIMTEEEAEAVTAGMERDGLMSADDLHIGLEELFQQQQNWDQQNQNDC